MNKLCIAAAIIICLSACSDDIKTRQKAVLNDVLKAHDKVMTDDDQVQLRSAQLDTLLKQKPELKAQSAPLNTQLDAAHDNMMNWMNQFKTEYTQQPSAEGIKYLLDQKQRLSAVDAKLIVAADKAAHFISQNQK